MGFSITTKGWHMLKKTARTKGMSCGSCTFERLNPPRTVLTADTRTINIVIPFDEGLKLHLALLERLQEINRLDLRMTEGKRAAINLSVNLQAQVLSVVPGKLSK